jgi:hypothetical protein
MQSTIRFLLLFLLLLFSGTPASSQANDPTRDSLVIESLTAINQLIGIKNDSAIALMDSAIEAHRMNNYPFGVARTQSLKSWAGVFSGRYEEGIRIGQEAFLIQQEIKDTSGMAETLNRLGVLNMKFERIDDATGYFTQSLSIFEKLQDSLRIDMVVNNIGVSYLYQQKYDSALFYYKKSLAIRNRISSPYWIAYQHYNIGEAFALAGNTDSAGYHLLTAESIFLEKDEGRGVPPMVLLEIGKYYIDINQKNAGISYLRKGLALSEEREQQGLILAGRESLARVLYEQQAYQEAYDMLDAWQTLKAELDSINSAERVAEMEGKFKSAQQEIAIAQLETDKLKAEKSAQRSQLIALGLGATMVLALFVLWALYNRKQQKQRLKESDLHTKIAEVKLQALKAQMNPHFVFNCINTTQNFVMNQQQAEAYEYLAKFARLLRLVLENSDEVFTSLEEEIQIISLYLELEAIRFDHNFTYQIDVEPALEGGIYLIPSMLIQPLVENALLHGIVNRKKEGGRISISFTLHQDVISCVVEDNGIGRAAAKRIKAQKAIHYQSKALPNIQSRIAILEQQIKLPTQLEFEDLYREGIPAGTRVKVSFPYK